MKKVIYQNQSDIFEKVVQRDGKIFRIRFVIIERCGQLRGKVISCEEVHTIRTYGKGTKYERRTSCLPPSCSQQQVKGERSKVKSIRVSPFFNISDLLTPIKIRAPSLTSSAGAVA